MSATIPKAWVVDCKHAGRGDKALTYLGKYLYRGVLQEKDILHCKNGKVTFRYTDNSGAIKIRTLPGADFLWLLLRHVLPKGFMSSPGLCGVAEYGTGLGSRTSSAYST